MISPTPTIEGQVGDSVEINCISPRPNEAVNNILEIYCPEQDLFVAFGTSPVADGRLARFDSESTTTYEFGPLMTSDNGIILVCSFSQLHSANSTISVICKF